MDLVEDGGQEGPGAKRYSRPTSGAQIHSPGTWKTELAHSGTPMGSGTELATDG